MVLTNLTDDYNSWQESWWGRWRRSHLDKNVILAEGTRSQPFPFPPWRHIHVLTQANL